MAAAPPPPFSSASSPRSAAASAAQLLTACGLPAAWQDQPQWRVLDGCFADGAGFCATWQAWMHDEHACDRLHVVAVCDKAPERGELLQTMAAFPDLAPHTATLVRHWFGLLPGFHRFELHGGRVSLTLCVGPLLATLRELQFVADSAYLHDAPAGPDASGDGPTRQPTTTRWDKWTIKALSRLCRVGTGVAVCDPHPALAAELQHAGFMLEPVAGSAVGAGRFRPRFTPTDTRSVWRRPPVAATECVVVGAGLAGATAAASLARRGWQVTVLDAANAPAQGASSLPVGLFVPLPSRDDNHRARLARAGIRLTLQAAGRLLRAGQDWAWIGVAEHIDATATPMLPPDWPREGRDWSHAGLPEDMAAQDLTPLPDNDKVVWHAAAGWIKPAALVRACLAQAGIAFRGNSAVAEIGYDDDGIWTLRDATGKTLARAPQLVLAAAGDSDRLCTLAFNAVAATDAKSRVGRSMGLGAVAGQVSWAKHATPQPATLFQRFPVNGAGSLVAHVPCDDGDTAWFVGASYETQPDADAERNAHYDNLARIARLQPPALEPARHAHHLGQLHAWRGTRCTTPDRLPVAGLRDAANLPGVWISVAMGSRGLTYAVLCAELVAAQLAGEPSPLPASLCKALAADRPALRNPSDHL